jgi:hypothetical protein
MSEKETGKKQEKPCTERQESEDVQETRRANRRIIVTGVLWRGTARSKEYVDKAGGDDTMGSIGGEVCGSV